MILLFLSISFIIAKKTFLILLQIWLQTFNNNVCYEKLDVTLCETFYERTMPCPNFYLGWWSSKFFDFIISFHFTITKHVIKPQYIPTHFQGEFRGFHFSEFWIFSMEIQSELEHLGKCPLGFHYTPSHVH